MARFATSQYEPPDEGNLRDVFMHLTNASLNKQHAEYVPNLAAAPAATASQEASPREGGGIGDLTLTAGEGEGEGGGEGEGEGLTPASTPTRRR